ncbi:hypothetical protein RRF57_003677 [Xylaria bambusicola]|uniref:Uncharacterized protein n=1 Tax=Xylaria bambusicola TaxID=326684 RepID=A0AAN7Z319_9PEZI
MRRIVEEDIESTLIIEDNMDCAKGIETNLIIRDRQLPKALEASCHLVHGLHRLMAITRTCGDIFPETLPENMGKPQYPKYTIYNDETVPPLSTITGLVNCTRYPEFTRWIHVSGGPICSFAYALSRSGVRKVLLDLSVDHLQGAFDNALAALWTDCMPVNSPKPFLLPKYIHPMRLTPQRYKAVNCG